MKAPTRMGTGSGERGIDAASSSGTVQALEFPQALDRRMVKRRERRAPMVALRRRVGPAMVGGLVLAAWAASAGPLKIELPPETTAFKPGPGAEVANGQCLVCHSVEYVVMQPPMPRPFWAAEVKKMREKYGAQLPEEQVEPVVSYLTQTYGVDTNHVAGAAAPTGGSASAPGVSAAITTGEGLATRYGCLGCHSVSTKIVGPPYAEVANKYRNDAKAVPKIAEQIHKGGSGKWGSTIMPPFPMISDAETQALAEWILSRK